MGLNEEQRRLVVQWMPMARMLARKSARLNNVPHHLEDLISVAMEALCTTAGMYDAARGKFSTIAWPRVLGALKFYLKKQQNSFADPAKQSVPSRPARQDAVVHFKHWWQSGPVSQGSREMVVRHLTGETLEEIAGSRGGRENVRQRVTRTLNQTEKWNDGQYHPKNRNSGVAVPGEGQVRASEV